jgi:hypothetical protein
MDKASSKEWVSTSNHFFGVEGMKWIKLAAENGIPQAIIYLGSLNEE